jgi:hypothetical protein
LHQRRQQFYQSQRRQQFYQSIGRPDLVPDLDDCYSSHDPRRHYRQVLRTVVAICTLFVHNITPNQAHFAHELLEAMCIKYMCMNVHLPPNFHQLLHLQEFILEYRSLYNTHTWPFEHANHDLTVINNNNHGKGVLEGTMMQGWWSNSATQILVSTFTRPVIKFVSIDHVIILS